MVAVATDESTVREGSERSTLVLSRLVGKELRVEDTSVVALLVELTKAERALLRMSKGIVDQKKVIDAPYALICKRTEAGLEHRSERREEIDVSHILLEFPSVEVFRH